MNRAARKSYALMEDGLTAEQMQRAEKNIVEKLKHEKTKHWQGGPRSLCWGKRPAHARPADK